MRQIIDNTSRFFTVVGAPYIAEHHADSDSFRHGAPRNSVEAATLFAPCSTGSWLNDDR